MFEKKVVVYLTRNKIWSGNFTTAKPQLTVAVWNGIDLAPVFKEVKETYKITSIRLILGDDLSYVLYVELADTEITREKILETAASLLPIELTDTNFDWKLVGKTPKKNLHLAQVWAISKEFLNAISYATKVNKLKIDLLVPISLVLAQAVENDTKPQLIVWSGQESLAVAVYKGILYHSEHLTVSQKDKIAALVSFVKTKFGLTVAVNEKVLDPLATVTRGSIVHGQDQDVMEIKLLENPTSPNDLTKSSSLPPVTVPSQKKQVFRLQRIFPQIFGRVAVLVVLIAVASTLYWVYRNSSTLPVSSSIASPDLEISASPPEASPTEVELSGYSGQVLNGSGTSGEATRVVELLQAEGFTHLETGNADSYEHTETLVQMKESVPTVVYDIIERSLNSDYRITKSEILTPQTKYDLIVIVGERISE